MTARRWHRSLDEALASQAVDRAQALARIRAEEWRAQIRPHMYYVRGIRSLLWTVETDAGEVLASGRAWSRRAAERRRDRALVRELNRPMDGRADS